METSVPAIIETVELTKVYGSGSTAVTALDHVSLKVAPGEFVAVMGPSGCGKSTLLNLLGGLDTPTGGYVRIGESKLSELSDDRLTELRRREIGFVFQFFNLIPVLSAVENAALPAALDGIKPREAREKAAGLLTQLGLSSRLENRPDQLSGGEQQRVAIARALISDPRFILADEPTGNLDTRAGDEIAAVLQKVTREWHRSIVMVTHDQRIAAYADRIIFLKDGKIFDQTVLDTRHSHNLETVASRMQALGD